MNKSTAASFPTPRLEIDLDAISKNGLVLRGDKKLIAVVKDNAYGLGAVEIARYLEATNTAAMFAVARLDEVEQLVAAAVRSPILLFQDTSRALASMQRGLPPTLEISINSIKQLSELAESKQRTKIHLQLDTGMNRLGIATANIATAVDLLCNNRQIQLSGIYSHFACADVPSSKTTDAQKKKFLESLDAFSPYMGTNCAVHLANSAGTFLHTPAARTTHVRVGISLYGCLADDSQLSKDIPIQPVVELVGKVEQIRDVKAGDHIGYGGTFCAEKKMKIALINVGYGQGLPRHLSSCGHFFVPKHKATLSIVGRISMDLSAVDCTDHPNLCEGDEVVCLTQVPNKANSISEVARQMQTIGYEILCHFPSWVSRRYTNQKNDDE